jgi:hypothetical protein
MQSPGKHRVHPRVEIPITPEEPDVLNAGDAMEGAGAIGLASGSSSATGWAVVSLMKRLYA